MKIDLAGKTAIVTGASGGIGSVTAMRLASENYKVVVNYSSRETNAEETLQAIKRSGGEAIKFRADVGDPVAVSAMFDAAEAAFGPVSHLVNNAAITNEWRMLEACDGAYVERLLRVNTVGPVLTTAEFARRFRGTTGRIVNVSSGAARYAVDGLSAYSASKAALEALTRCHALELGARGITVNAVAPGFVDIGQLDSFTPSDRDRMLAITMLNRFGKPADIASMIAFLLSDDSDWITGQVYDVNGGPRLLPR